MLVLSGPSGCGKSTLCHELVLDPRVVFSVSATTRPIRLGEVDGQDYLFLTAETFKDHVDAGNFIEWAEVHGHLYGTLRAPMDAALAQGKVYLLEIDVQGALQLKALNVPGIYVFIAPPDFEERRRRLVGRQTETPEGVERRLKKAEDEYRERVKYDHVVVNDDVEQALDEIRAIAGLTPNPENISETP
jgi:guanylate kinase